MLTRRGRGFGASVNECVSNRAETTCSIAIAVILSAAKDLSTLADEILRCAQDDSQGIGQVISAQILKPWGTQLLKSRATEHQRFVESVYAR